MAKVVSINISEKKGTAKQPVEEARLVENHGVEGDAHAGPGDRQVSLLALESYRRFKKQNMHRHCLKYGSFGENIITEGVELHTLPLGTQLRTGETVLEVSKIGKECHAPCAIARSVGSCIMPREGIFASVIKGGVIKKGERVEIFTAEELRRE